MTREPPERDEPPELERAEDARAAALLRDLPAVPPGAAVRLRRRLEGAGAPPARRPVLAPLVAAAGLVAALFAASAGWSPPEPPRPLAGALAAEGGWGVGAVVPGVQVSFLGTGAVEGTSESPEVRWDLGTLNVEVVPDRGIRFAVRTREALVRVVGTGFSVTRDALGTRVHVLHGRVEVRCGDAPSVLLEAGGDRACLPTSAAGLLGRARAQMAAGAPPQDVLATLDQGLLLGSGPVAEELEVARIGVLLDLGRRDEARAAADVVLARGGHRADEAARLRDEASR